MEEPCESVAYLSPKEVAAMVPTKPGEGTVRAWMRDGITVRIGGDETLVRLQHHVIGGRLWTTVQYVQDFLGTIQSIRDEATGFGQKASE